MYNNYYIYQHISNKYYDYGQVGSVSKFYQQSGG